MCDVDQHTLAGASDSAHHHCLENKDPRLNRVQPCYFASLQICFVYTFLIFSVSFCSLPHHDGKARSQLRLQVGVWEAGQQQRGGGCTLAEPQHAIGPTHGVWTGRMRHNVCGRADQGGP